MIPREYTEEANEELKEHGQISTQLAEAIFNAGKPANTRSYHEE